MRTVGQLSRFLQRVRQANSQAYDMCEPEERAALEAAEEAYKRVAEYLRGPGKPRGLGSASPATRQRVTRMGGRARWKK